MITRTILETSRHSVTKNCSVPTNCSSNLKIFANSQPSASNFKRFSRSLQQFVHIVGQNNFGNKIPFLFTETNGFGWAKGRQRDLLRILPGFKLSNEPKSGFAVIRIYALPSFNPMHHGAKFFMISKKCFAKLLERERQNKWYFVTKIVLVIENIFWNSRLKAENLQNFLRSIEQFDRTVKGQNNFW